MLIKEVVSVFWQTLKDSWEELLSLAVVNLIWLFSWGLPIAALTIVQNFYMAILSLLLSFVLFPITMAGIYVVTNRVAHGKTFHLSDFWEGIRTYWWRSLLWLLANIVFLFLIWTNLQFYPTVFEGNWVVFIAAFWIAVAVFWLAMQAYFWPLLVEQDAPHMLTAWRNAALLILANPFYAFFLIAFHILLLLLSGLLSLPLMFMGMTLIGLLGNNGVLTLLAEFDIIDSPRPKPLNN